MQKVMEKFFQGCDKASVWIDRAPDAQFIPLLFGVAGVVASLFGVVAALSLSMGFVEMEILLDKKYRPSATLDALDVVFALLSCAGFAITGVVFQAACAFLGDGTFHLAGRFGFSYSWLVYALLAYGLGSALRALLDHDYIRQLCDALGIKHPTSKFYAYTKSGSMDDPIVDIAPEGFLHVAPGELPSLRSFNVRADEPGTAASEGFTIEWFDPATMKDDLDIPPRRPASQPGASETH